MRAYRPPPCALGEKVRFDVTTQLISVALRAYTPPPYANRPKVLFLLTTELISTRLSRAQTAAPLASVLSQVAWARSSPLVLPPDNVKFSRVSV